MDHSNDFWYNALIHGVIILEDLFECYKKKKSNCHWDVIKCLIMHFNNFIVWIRWFFLFHLILLCIRCTHFREQIFLTQKTHCTAQRWVIKISILCEICFLITYFFAHVILCLHSWENVTGCKKKKKKHNIVILIYQSQAHESKEIISGHVLRFQQTAYHWKLMLDCIVMKCPVYKPMPCWELSNWSLQDEAPSTVTLL